MLSKAKKIFGFLVLMSVGLNAQAGHLFTQALLNTPITLSAGFGIDIPQLALEGVQTNSYINVCDFGPGDSLRVTLPGYTQTFAFDSLPAGWTTTEVACPGEQSIDNASEPALNALNLPAPFDWRVDALAGSFTLLGYRLGVSNGTVDGTNSGTVNQTGVTPTGATAVPIFQPIHMVLLVLALVGIAGIRQRMSRQH